jgi:hypothetical protein
MINSNNENQDKLQKVTYQTHGTCSKYICISVDEDGTVRDAEFIGQGSMRSDKKHEGQGRDSPTERHHLRQQANQLSRPVGYCPSANGILI